MGNKIGGLQMKKRDIFGFRGWILTIHMLLAFFGTFGIVGSMNIMAPYYSAVYGWDAAFITSTYTIAGIAAVIVQYIIGKLLVKGSAKKWSLFFAILYCAFLVVFGFVTKLWQYTVIMIILKITQDGWVTVSEPKMLAQWFPTKKGKVIGISTFGIPIGTGIGMAIIATILGNTGKVYLSYLPFLIATVIALLMLAIFLTDNPEECGCYPDNNADFDKEAMRENLQREMEAQKNCPWTAKRILSLKESWFAVVGVGVLLLGAAGIMTQVTSVLIAADAAFYASYGNYVMMSISVFACLGSFIFGVVDDRIGTPKAACITCIFMLVSCLFGMSGKLVLTLISVVLMATFMGAGSNYMVSIVVYLFGRSGFQKAYFITSPTTNIIAAVGPALIAYVAKGSGSYRASYIVLAVLAFIAAICNLMIRKENVLKKEAEYVALDGVDYVRQ